MYSPEKGTHGDYVHPIVTSYFIVEKELNAISSSLPSLLSTIPHSFSQEHMTSGANCQTFTSSTVISYSNLGDGPKVYQETSEMRSAPGGVRRRLLALLVRGEASFGGFVGGHLQHFGFAVSCSSRSTLCSCDSLNRAKGPWEEMGRAGNGESILLSL